MKHIKFIAIVAIITGVLAILALIAFKPLTIFIATLQGRGSFTKTQAISNNCNGKDIICIMQNGKIISKKVTTKQIQKSSPTKDQHIQYAVNVAAAVTAIRAYTHIPNLKLTQLNRSIPTHITYYCSPDKKCWAVDNQTHQVIPSGTR